MKFSPREITFTENTPLIKVIKTFNKTAQITESKGFGLVINTN